MTEETLEQLSVRLARKLSVDDTDTDVLLLMEDELEGAESEILLYLNMEFLPERLQTYVVKLAALFYQRDAQGQDSDWSGTKSWNYSEGEQSQSATLLSPEDYQNAIHDILDSLARYRQVGVRGATDETA